MTRNKRRINYADLNLGIDSNDDSSPPPRKCKQSKAITLCEPSQTVIAARNQWITRKSLQKSDNEQTKLIGTVIITPPAKEIKNDNDGQKVKTEQDWLKLPKNIPNENISLDDPNVCPRLIHKDGTICQSKTYWSSIKRKPPLKEFELPDLFSDNEELEAKIVTENMSPKKPTSTEMCMDKDTSLKGNKGSAVNTEKSVNKTTMLSENIAKDMPSKEPNPTEPPSVNTEKTGNNIQTEPASTHSEQDLDNTTNKENVSAENDAVNIENRATNLEIDYKDNKLSKQDGNEALVTTKNDNIAENLMPNNVNTMNTNETDHKDNTSTNQIPNRTFLITQGRSAINVNTEKSPNNHDKPTTSTPKTPKTHNQKVTKDEWSSLMFSSDDSLFEEMTKQLEDDTIRTNTDKKASQSVTCTIAAASTSTKDQDTLPDIVHTSNRTVAAAGLLMLGVDPKDKDREIDNEVVMPVNKQMQQGQNNTGDNNNKENRQKKRKKKKQNHDSKDSPRKSTLETNKLEPTTPKTTSTTSIFPSSPTSPGSPQGVLRVTHYKLRKGTLNKYVHKPLKCSMCDKAVNSKDELRTHHQEIHNIISCKECNKGFAMKESLRKHTYTHTSGNNYECILCKNSSHFQVSWTLT